MRTGWCTGLKPKNTSGKNLKRVKKPETETFVSSWYLTNITNPFLEPVNFFYRVTGNKIYKKNNYASYKMLAGYQPQILFSSYVMFGDKNGIQQYEELAGARVTGLSTSETYTDEVVLSMISFPSGSIEFETRDRLDLNLQNHLAYGKLLYRIVLKRALAGSEEVFKTYTCNYSYFYAHSSQPAYISKRLMLTGITESAGSIVKPPYKLFYNADNIPDKENTTNFGGFLTDPNAGLLNKIVYPTGGFSTFLYESNIQGAGPRIKRIEHNDGNASTGVRVYEYEGGKQLTNSFPINGASTTSYISGTMYNGASTLAVQGTLVYKTYLSSDQCMMGESSGDYMVGYDKVTEYLGEKGEYGKSEFVFKNIASPLTYGVPAEVSSLNGTMVTKEEFINKMGSFIPSKKTVREVVAQQVSTTTVKRRFQDACNNNYSLRTDWVKLQSETEYNYDGVNPVVLSKTYQYGNAEHILPTIIETTDSKESSWQTQYKYPFEKAREEGGVYAKMVARHIVSPVVEETVVKDGRPLKVTRTKFREWSPAVIAPETEELKQGAATSEIRVRFYGYDAAGNPLEVSKENDMHTSYVWDYNSTYPVAQVTNASAANIGYTGFETADLKDICFIEPSGIYRGDAFTGSRSFNLSDLSSSTWGGIAFYMPFVNRPYIVSFWAKNGMPILHYGNNNTIAVGSAYRHGLPVNGWSYYEVEISNLTDLYVKGTGLIDELRIYPGGAQMSTYTYTPLTGMSAECDRNNRVQRYQYDELGRLQCIKDPDNNIVKTFEYHSKY